MTGPMKLEHAHIGLELMDILVKQESLLVKHLEVRRAWKKAMKEAGYSDDFIFTEEKIMSEQAWNTVHPKDQAA